MKFFLVFVLGLGSWVAAEEGMKPLPLQVCSADAERAIELNDEGVVLSHRSEPDRMKIGLAKLEEALDYDPNNPQILFNICQLYLIFRPEVKEMHNWNDEQLFQRVEDYSRRAGEIGGTYQLWFDYGTNLLYAHKNLGLPLDSEKASGAWRKVRGLSSTQDQVFNSWVNEGRSWLWSLDKEKAQTCFWEAIKLKPDSVVAAGLLEKVKSSN